MSVNCPVVVAGAVGDHRTWAGCLCGKSSWGGGSGRGLRLAGRVSHAAGAPRGSQ